jgi:hypothetical protein
MPTYIFTRTVAMDGETAEAAFDDVTTSVNLTDVEAWTVEVESTIHRTIFTVEVLSEGPLSLACRDDDPFDLLAIHYEITEGGCIGQVEQTDATIVPADKVRDALVRVGNDGTFFEVD